MEGGEEVEGGRRWEVEGTEEMEGRENVGWEGRREGKEVEGGGVKERGVVSTCKSNYPKENGYSPSTKVLVL